MLASAVSTLPRMRRMDSSGNFVGGTIRIFRLYLRRLAVTSQPKTLPSPGAYNPPGAKSGSSCRRDAGDSAGNSDSNRGQLIAGRNHSRQINVERTIHRHRHFTGDRAKTESQRLREWFRLCRAKGSRIHNRLSGKPLLTTELEG